MGWKKAFFPCPCQRLLVFVHNYRMSREEQAAGPSHVTTVVRAPVYCNCFALCYEFPIPWIVILSRHEKLLLGDYVCCAGLAIILKGHTCLAEPQDWRLHCHCGDKHSLQCLSAKLLLQSVVLDFIKGARVNRTHMWYREFVNSGRPDEIGYVGSVLYRNIHFIYFRLHFPRHIAAECLEIVRACIGGNSGFIVQGTFNFWLVLMCNSCAPNKYEMLKSCALKVRATIKRMLDEIHHSCLGYFPLETSRMEERRQSTLRQSMLYGRCRQVQSVASVNMFAFNHS